MEGLHGLINRAARMGDIKGFSLCRRGPELTHLLFANDNLCFAGQTLKNVKMCCIFWTPTSKHQARKSIKIRPSYFSTNPHQRLQSKLSNMPWDFKKLLSMRNILVCLLRWGGIRKRVSIT